MGFCSKQTQPRGLDVTPRFCPYADVPQKEIQPSEETRDRRLSLLYMWMEGSVICRVRKKNRNFYPQLLIFFKKKIATLFPFNLCKQRERICKPYFPFDINKCCLPLPLSMQVNPQSGLQSVLSDDFTRSAYGATVYLFLPCENRMLLKASITDTQLGQNGF